jgi:hypothetical protein
MFSFVGKFRKALALEVGFAGAMATGAGGRASVRLSAVFGLADQQHLWGIAFIMASGTLGIAFEDEVIGRRRRRNARQDACEKAPSQHLSQ